MTVSGPEPAELRDSRRPLLALTALLLLSGALPLIGLLLAGRWAPLASGWSALFGWLAWPLAGLALAAGGWLAGALVRGLRDPWILPWGRALAVEMALVAALALLSFARDGGGMVGWALAEASRAAIGPVMAVLVWATMGIVGSLLTFRFGTDRLALWFESVAQALEAPQTGPARPGAPAPTRSQATPRARWAPGRASSSSPRATADDDTTREEPAPARGNILTGRPGRAHRDEDPADAAGGEGRAAAPPPSPLPLRPEHKGPPKLRIASGGKSTARRVTRATALPEIALLGEEEVGGLDAEGLRAVASRIEQTLHGFGVAVKVVEIEHGPTVTRFGLVPGTYERAGETRRVKVSRITSLRDDLALALSAPSIRIEAPVPGKAMVGIEIPNPETAAVGMAALLRDKHFRAAAAKSNLALALGRDVSGAVAAADLAKMPHLLVAGATGSGKSVCLNTILASLLFQNTPDVLRLILVDPKRVELSRYRRLPHLVAPVVTDVSEVVGALRWTAVEMDNRYKLFSERGARDLKAYNRKLPSGEPPLPRIVLIIDELADLMLQAPEETEPLLTRLAQLARATGIHLVVATQRPSTDVITGLIKANFPARIAFAVTSATDSRVILDGPGAEQLLGRGDMLFQPPDAPRPRRLQGAFVSDEELDRLVEFWKGSPWAAPPRLPPWDDLIPSDNPEEALYEEAVAIALAVSRVSASLLQRRLRIGYGRARALLERMRAEDIVDAEGRPDRGPDPVVEPAPQSSPEPARTAAKKKAPEADPPAKPARKRKLRPGWAKSKPKANPRKSRESQAPSRQPKELPPSKPATKPAPKQSAKPVPKPSSKPATGPPPAADSAPRRRPPAAKPAGRKPAAKVEPDLPPIRRTRRSSPPPRKPVERAAQSEDRERETVDPEPQEPIPAPPRETSDRPVDKDFEEEELETPEPEQDEPESDDDDLSWVDSEFSS